MTRPEFKHIVNNPHILRGVPIIKGTRIPVSTVLMCFLDGYSKNEVYTQTNLNRDQVNEALSYAAWAVDQNE